MRSRLARYSRIIPIPHHDPRKEEHEDEESERPQAAQKLGLSQTEFWSRIEVTQSGGSRYENGRTMPGPVRKLLGIVYLKEKP